MQVSAFEGPLGPTLFTIIRGTPSAEELAVVTALLTALAATGGPEHTQPSAAAEAADWGRAEAVSPVCWMARP